MEGVMKRCAYFLVTVFVVGLFSLALASEAEATSIYVKMRGIPGESRDKDHRNWIDAESISHQIENRVGVSVSGGRSAGRTQFDFVVHKEIDKATPKLNLYCASGRNIPEVIIELTASYTDAGRVAYMEYRLQDVRVTSVRAGVTGSKKAGTEEVTLSFRKITSTYTELDVRGRKKGEIAYTWDLRANRGKSVQPK